jgi:ABC-2 type transport system ATP-binding protein
MIKVTSLSKKVSEIFSISIDELTINEGEMVALIGSNGSGKTFLLNSILNNILQDSGRIEIGNIENKYDSWKRFTGIYMNENYLLDFMTPFEYFSFIGSFYDVPRKRIPEILVKYNEFLGKDIYSIKDKLISKFSRGTRDKIGIIGASFYEPKLLILDEPISHLDAASISFLRKYWEMINKQNNTTLLISSPTLNELSSICSRILIMERGKIKYDLTQNNENLKFISEYFSS